MTFSMPGLGHLLRLSVIASSLMLAACSSAQRLSGPFGTERLDGSPRRTPAYQTAPVYNEPVQSGEPVGGGYGSTAPITTQELPPPEPRYGAPQISSGPSSSTVMEPAFPSTQESAPVRQPPVMSGGGRVATLGEGSASGPRPANTRDGVIGGWTAREANGSSCRVQLSSSPALDRYKASASSCGNKDLQKATTWDYQDGEVFLYQPGGGVVARLRASDGSGMSGVIAKSGAGLSLSR